MSYNVTNKSDKIKIFRKIKQILKPKLIQKNGVFVYDFFVELNFKSGQEKSVK